MRLLTLLILCILFLPSRQEHLDTREITPFGYSNGQFSVTDAGSATYTIPLSLSPGTAGMTPDLAIAYSSQGGNGILGNGWSLLGISTISRSGKTLAQDNEVRGVKLDGSDTYSLDGERLVLVSGNYGADGAEYRTEQNAFIRVISHGDVNGSPEKFKVWTKAGLVMEYGFVGNARVEAQETGNIVFWLVNKIQDTKGNYILFNYEKDVANGDYRPISIEYTGNFNTGLTPYNRVEFEYDDRPDNIARYITGRKIQTNKILKSIKSFYGEQVAREYRFDYVLSTYSKKCLLKSVTECGMDGTCLEPTVFSWKEEEELGFNSFSTIPVSELNHDNIAVFQGDWNGDGLIDLVMLNTETGNNKYFINSWDFDFTSFTAPDPIAAASLKNGITNFIDFNSDGYTDVVWYDPNTGKNTWYVNGWANAGDLSFYGFSDLIESNILKAMNNEIVQLYFSDWNGDGRTDLLAYHKGSGKNRFFLNASLSEGTPIFSSVGNPGLIPESLIRGGTSLIPTDWNSDGLTDLMWYDQDSGSTRWFSNRGDGHSLTFNSPTDNPITASNIQGGDGIQLGDWNGDGVTDLMWYDIDAGNTRWYLHKGDLSFLECSNAMGGVSLSAYRSIYLVDINGDNYDDLLLFNKDSGQNKWLTNDGKCQFTEYPDSNNPIAPLLVRDGVFTFGGFGGESIVDILWINKETGESSFFENQIGVNNLIDTITAGNGFTTAVEYRPLTDEELYTKETNAVYPDYDFQNKFYAVFYYTVDDGIGGKNKMSYKYKGAKMNLQGRGFRGFTEIHVTDVNSGIVASKYFNRDHRFIGSPLERAETRLADGTLIDEVINKDTLFRFYNDDNSPLATQFAYTYESIARKYELDGTLVSTVVTKNKLDDYGNPIWIVVDYGNGYKDSTFNQYQYNGYLSNWILGRLSKSEVTKFAPGQEPSIKSSAFEYDPFSGLLVREISEPSLPIEDRIQKDYIYDEYGNIIKSTTTFFNGSEFESRSTYTVFDEKGRFLVSEQNSLQHTTASQYDPILGHKLVDTDINGLSTRYEYDPFGRLTQTIYPDGTWKGQSYRKCDGSCPQGAIFYLLFESSSSKPVKEYYDILGREIMEESVGFNGNPIFIQTEYNKLGLVKRKSFPFYQGDPILWTEFTYDILGREIRVLEPGEYLSQTYYNGLSTSQVNPKGQSHTVIKDVVGRMVESIDNEGNSVYYAYDASGNLTEIRDPEGNAISMTYDIYSNRISLIDPDMGTYVYAYNAIGELLSETDPKGNIIVYEYDNLGRPVRRTEPEGETTWRYDIQEHGVGLLASIHSEGYDYQYEVVYDEYSRVHRERETIEGEEYETAYYFDSIGRPLSTYYPWGFGVRYGYNENFYLKEVENLNGELFWQANAVDAYGQLLRQTFGNNTVTSFTYNSNTQWLEEIEANNELGQIQHLAFSYDSIGNLKNRTDYLNGLNEFFEYDGLNRLSSSLIPFQDTVTTTYDILGNITYKSDVGRYFYGENGAGPHQLTRIEGNGIQPCIPSSLTDFAYTSFNKVSTISNDSLRLEIDYAPTYSRKVQRFYRNDSLARTKIHVGNALEIEKTDSLTRAMFYVRALGKVVAVHTVQTDGASKTHYWHRDQIGSLQSITDEDGQLVQVLNFDAWGKRRSPDGTPIAGDTRHLFDRGYTGHEHIDLFLLINMNGRIYDPVIGRFISPDPFIQDETDLQNLNRYSYVLNNPLSHTDPSGYFFKKIGGAFKKTARVFKRGVKRIARGIGQVFRGKFLKGLGSIGKGFLEAGVAMTGTVAAHTIGQEALGEELWNTLVVTAASIAVGTVSFGTGSALSAAILSGAASGFAGGALGTVLAGGSVSDALTAGVKGAVIGGFTAAATFGVGNLANTAGDISGSFSDKAAYYGIKMVGHGTVQGGMSELKGGKFIHGFYSSAMTIAGQSGIDRIGLKAGRVVAAAVLGGTAAELGGGKFANGAISGFMVRLYNRESKFEIAKRVGVKALNVAALYSCTYGQAAPGWGQLACGVTFSAALIANVHQANLGINTAFQNYTQGNYAEFSLDLIDVGVGLININPLSNTVMGTSLEISNALHQEAIRFGLEMDKNK